MAKMLCTSCGTVGETRSITKGSIFIEIILWLCFLVPGIIYSIWRLTTRHQGCRACDASTVIPLSSPVAQKFIREATPPVGAA
jgi:hypothetical protein